MIVGARRWMSPWSSWVRPFTVCSPLNHVGEITIESTSKRRQSLLQEMVAWRPERGLFWHPASGTSDDQEVCVHYGFPGTVGALLEDLLQRGLPFADHEPVYDDIPGQPI